LSLQAEQCSGVDVLVLGMDLVGNLHEHFGGMGLFGSHLVVVEGGGRCSVLRGEEVRFGGELILRLGANIRRT
jgi:hypothetical protein